MVAVAMSTIKTHTQAHSEIYRVKRMQSLRCSKKSTTTSNPPPPPPIMANLNNMSKYDFTGKVALITGSSSGIGAAIALELAKYGASVTITGRDAEALDNVAKQIKSINAAGPSSSPLQMVGNLLDETFVSQLVDHTVATFGRLDILINNAGGSAPNDSFDNVELLQVFDRMMALNVRSVLQLIQKATPHLERAKGNIVNISSIAAIIPLTLVYSTTKAALDMLTRSCANILASKGIRVNSINPGMVRTGFGRSMNAVSDMAENEMVQNFIQKNTPLRRLPEPNEIANLAVFLASDDAANMTGSIIVSDGGVIINPRSLTE